MTIRLVDGRLAIVRLELSPSEIPALLKRQAGLYPGAELREQLALKLIASDFDQELAYPFVKSVCEWGRGHRHLTRIRSGNTDAAIANALKSAFTLAEKGDISGGVERIRGIVQLGQSFASKQLRFLAPTRAVILDSVLREQIGYPETAVGYDRFLNDCDAILQFVRASEELSFETRHALRICDIEAALFASFQGH
jgi:hypothetical protein